MLRRRPPHFSSNAVPDGARRVSGRPRHRATRTTGTCPRLCSARSLSPHNPQDGAGTDPNGFAAAELEVDLAAIYLDGCIPALGCVVGPPAARLEDAHADREAGR